MKTGLCNLGHKFNPEASMRVWPTNHKIKGFTHITNCPNRDFIWVRKGIGGHLGAWRTLWQNGAAQSPGPTWMRRWSGGGQGEKNQDLRRDAQKEQLSHTKCQPCPRSLYAYRSFNHVFSVLVVKEGEQVMEN